MAHGGARAHSGPPPDPNALRRDRESDWLLLPPRTGRAPKWPLSVPATPAEETYWRTAWKTPQATQWAKHGLEVEVALYVRTLGEAEQPGAAANLRNLVKQLQENLGLSLPGLARYRWKIQGDSTAATASKTPAARPARGAPSSRTRFTVVPVAEEE